MDRDKFNKLDIDSQIDYFNNELKKENNNFNCICKQIGISKNTVLNRFKKNGFEPLRKGQKIISFFKEVKEKEVKTKIEKIEKEIKHNNKDQISFILNRIDLLEKKVKELEKHKTTEDKHFINSYNNTVTKTFKIDIEINKQLEEVFNKYKMYKKQDIISSLLKYALNNIK